MTTHKLFFNESLNEFLLVADIGIDNRLDNEYFLILFPTTVDMAYRFIESVKNKYDRPVTLDEVKKCFEKFEK